MSCQSSLHLDTKVIVVILQDPDPHDRQIYELFGAKELDWYEIAAKIQLTLGIRVRYEPIEVSTMVAALTVAGGDPNRAHHLGMVTQDYRDGFYSGFNNVVEEITGSKPTTVEDHVRATRASFEADGELAITDAKLSAI